MGSCPLVGWSLDARVKLKLGRYEGHQVELQWWGTHPALLGYDANPLVHQLA